MNEKCEAAVKRMLISHENSSKANELNACGTPDRDTLEGDSSGVSKKKGSICFAPAEVIPRRSALFLGRKSSHIKFCQL